MGGIEVIRKKNETQRRLAGCGTVTVTVFFYLKNPFQLLNFVVKSILYAKIMLSKK